jgi:hypothetical protein
VLPSAPRVTVQIAPEVSVTAMTSAGRAVSATWKVVGRDAVEAAVGNTPGLATVHVSDVPAAGALMPPELTTVCASLLKTSSAISGLACLSR